jgi:phosphoribosylformylglycinamidine cyclo-ligase
MPKKVTYKQAGVDIEGMDALKSRLKPLVRRSFRPEVLKDIGGFGSFFGFPKDKYRDPVLVSSSDGVGTKLKIAWSLGVHDSVGIDAVAMNVNDILCVGAEPLFFLDYIAFSDVDHAVLFDVVKGITKGCVQSNCSLIGGETAQMPGMYAKGEYDIAGFCVGAVERAKAIDGSKIRPGDAVVGLASSGLHSNGYSLVRKVFTDAQLKRYGKELLVPTRIYVREILALLASPLRESVHGIAHITGGAFYDKIRRILPADTGVRIHKASWTVPKLFRLVQAQGNVEDHEMYHTLNMGIGMVLLVDKAAAKAVADFLAKEKVRSWTIGEAVRGERSVEVI